MMPEMDGFEFIEELKKNLNIDPFPLSSSPQRISRKQTGYL
jgi:CheY-like chemotaxis protein